MGLILVPATRENLEKSIEKSVDMNFARQYLSKALLEEIVRYSGAEGIRCWAMTQSNIKLFNDLQNGDEVLLTEKGTKRFTHYGIIVAKTQNEQFGSALWPFVGKNPWENVYFLANITRISIEKATFVDMLGYSKNYNVPGPIRVKDIAYNSLGTISTLYNIPVFDYVAESNTDKDFSSENIEVIGSRRVGHTRFSKDVKSNYGYACAVCDIKETEFLVAGHISSWAEDKENRLNPRNGICLCPLHDKAFEHGYIGLDDKFSLLISPRLAKDTALYMQLKIYHGKIINIPVDNEPDKIFLEIHRKKHGL